MQLTRLKGIPRVTEESDWLEDNRRIHFSEEEDGLGIEFKTTGGGEREFRDGAEFLASMIVNRPDDICFGLGVDTDEMGIYLCVDRTNMWLGDIPKPLEIVLRRNWVQFISSRLLTARKFQVGVSLVGKEVDRNMVMDAGELVGDMSENAFNELMDEYWHEDLNHVDSFRKQLDEFESVAMTELRQGEMEASKPQMRHELDAEKYFVSQQGQ